jgi:anti-sigma B factor antagonist
LAIQRRLVEAVEVTEGHVHVIRLKDIFDASTVNEFEKVVSYLLARNFYKVIVDLGHVEFISSAGWGAFTAELRRVRQNQGDVKLANMSPDLYDVFLLLELDSFIQSFDTVDEAIAAFSRPIVAQEPETSRPSILQEIMAAARSREMAEAGARGTAERHKPDFVEPSRELVTAGQEAHAADNAFFVSDKKMSAAAPDDNKRQDRQLIEHTIDNGGFVNEKAGSAGSPNNEESVGEQLKYAVDRPARESEAGTTAFAPNAGDGFGGQSEYAVGNDTAEAEYEGAFGESYEEYGTDEQTVYAGDDDSAELGYENSSGESYEEYGADEQTVYAGDDGSAELGYENSSGEPYEEYGADEQTVYAGDDGSAEIGYENSSGEPYEEYGADEQTVYAGDDGSAEIGDENSSGESYEEYGATEQTVYAGDNDSAEIGYENSSGASYEEYGTDEQTVYAGDDGSAEIGDENSSGASYEEYGADEQTVFAGDDGSAEIGDENSSGASYEEHGTDEQTVYAGDDGSAEIGDENSSGESYEEYGTDEQTVYAGDNDSAELGYENSSGESYEEYGADEQTVYAGDEYTDEAGYENLSAEPDGSSSKAQSDYALENETDENGIAHLKLPAPADSGPEMWELIIASGEPRVAPHSFRRSEPSLPEGERPREFFAAGTTNPISDRPSEKAPLPDSESGSSEHEIQFDAEHDIEQFAGLGTEPDFSFAEHEPFVENNSPVEPASSRKGGHAEKDHAALAFSDETDFWPAQVKPLLDDEFDELETQDIRDPWILDEIDTLPDEYEMEDSAITEDEPSIAASELLSYDLELESPQPLLPDQARDHDETTVHAEEFPAPDLSGGNSTTPDDGAFDPQVKSETKRISRTKKAGPEKSKSKMTSRTKNENEEAQNELDFAVSAEAPAFLQPDEATEYFPGPSSLDENSEMIDRVSELPPPSSHHGSDEAGHDYPPDGALPKIPASDNLEEIVRAVVATHPDFGPAMICKFIEDRFEPPVLISRSTIYRFLREADLNTREKRQEYADQLFDPSARAEEI